MGMQAILGWLCGHGVDWSIVEDSTWCGFKASNSIFCISSTVMGSLIPLSRKDFNKKENKEQSPILFLLKTSLSLSYLLHNSMSQ